MAKHAHSRDLHVRVRYGDLSVDVTAEAVSYAPDALDDMQRKAIEAFADAWRIVEPFERFTTALLESPLEELVEEDHED